MLVETNLLTVYATQMLNNKYYTPAINDFYPGYEYEYKKHDGVYYSNEEFDNKEWIKGIYGFNDFPYVERTMLGRMQYQTVRVKQLDIWDIESLGWTLGNILNDDDEFVEGFSKGDSDTWCTLETLDNLKIRITSICYTNEVSQIWKVLFEGKCRSINELRTIENLIGI